MKKAVIFGAGKIARGFVAQLLFNSGYTLCFIDIDQALVAALNQAKMYTVHILGNEALSTRVDRFTAVSLQNTTEIIKAMADADLIFTSVGGKNLTSVGHVIGDAFNQLPKYPDALNIVTCENWKHAGLTLQKAIEEKITDKETWEKHGAVSEGVIMRIATQPSEAQRREAPLDLWVQNFWDLPIDQATFKGNELHVAGMKLIPNFGRFLEQKMYTNNTSNALIAYYGYQLGYRVVAEAANAEVMRPLLDEIYREINAIMIAELHADADAQMDLALKAREKYSDWKIVDQVIRHGKDPLRKLGPEDRLIAPARMGIRHGIAPTMIVKAIAAALYFDEPSDEAAMQLQTMRKTKGIPYVLKEVCKLDEQEPLWDMIMKEIAHLQKEGILHE